MRTTVTRESEDEEEDANQEEDEEDRVTGTQSSWTPDLHWLTDSLAIGGCFPIERAAELAGSHGITAVVDLREEDRDDEERLRAAGIDFLHLPTPDLLPASTDMLDRGVRFAREHIERGEKVLIHCQHGIGRSALLSLCILVDQGREPLDALLHAKGAREVVSPSFDQYRGWAEWLRTRGKTAPDYHSFGCIAYRHLANG
ncbi:MAG: protein phosphatase [Sphingomonas sp.]|nr:protein phosphatase [Sphingomonas sp.]